MHLGFSGFFGVFFWAQFAVYALLLFVFMLCSLERLGGGGLGSPATAVAPTQLTTAGLAFTVSPLFFLALCAFWLLRAYAVPAPLLTLGVTPPGLAWLIFAHLVGFILTSHLLLVGGRALRTTLPEFVLALLVLTYVWAWLGCVTNWLTALLMFELAALAILLLSTHLFLASPSRSALGAPAPEASELSFLKFFVFFLWLSVVATFLFFWVLAVSFDSLLSFDVHAAALLYAGA